MQRVLSRNLLARNQALKQSRRRNEKQLKEKLRNIKQGTIVRGRLERSNIKAEQTNRREDWMLGPLAPNRLIGKDGGNYGLLPTEAIRPPEVLERDRPKFFNFAVNDRVVVVKGRERGKIGKVKDIDLDMQTVTLAGINMVSFS